jgi:hypothetical protein
MAHSTGLLFDPPSQASLIDPRIEDEAFELAFAEAENAVHPPETAMEPEPEVKLSEEEEADRLAQTAGELFDRLQYERDNDEKFRNSSFMALMKKLRDREVIVSGNDMVESSRVHTLGTNGVDDTVSM